MDNLSKRIIMKFIVVFVIITTMIMISVNGFGFDAGTACDPKNSRKGRAQLLATIPCDLTMQAYCNLPGAAYPWHAVRRFVHENQGLMRRMYGDVRHISVLRTEIENNDIEVDDIENTAARYSKTGQRKTKYLYTEFQNNRNNDVLSEPHFRPMSTTTTSSSTSTTSTSTTSTTTSKPNISDSVPIVEDYTIEDLMDVSVETNSVYENLTDIAAKAQDHIKLVKAPNFGQNKTETATISTTLKLAPAEKWIDNSLSTTYGTTSHPDDSSEEIKTETSVKFDESTIKEQEKVLSQQSQPLQQPQPQQEEEQQQQPDDRIDENVDDVEGESYSLKRNGQQTILPNDDAVINSINDKNSNFSDDKLKVNGHMEGQLFQDVVQKEAPPVLNSRGINACPVKEEVVAPFWANNTRGEVLALLNLYPFEQYVHWEKCTHEHKQMYCRDGCRCEQQYRLHRLLAYDPHNECRGIFSDWFRFPSCCICKCYDIPMEFRGTSRSPRAIEKQKRSFDINDLENNVQSAIYEHATEDWYRPRDVDNF